MKCFSILLLACFALIAPYSYSQIQSDETPYVPGQLIIMLDERVEPADIVSRFSEVNGIETGVKHVEELSSIANIHLFSFDEEKVKDTEILKSVGQAANVVAAQFNHYVTERATLPNDPSINTQWHHKNAGDKDIDSDLAWDITTGGLTADGDEIVVCVIEPGGSNYNHNDLIANHWRNLQEIPNNGQDDDGNGYVDDYDGWRPSTNSDNLQLGGHGTSVSGMIGAKGNNGIGGSGVNWNVKIMQVQVSSLTESNVIAAYAYPLNMRTLYNNTNGASGAFVVATNASWGIDNANPNNYPVWCGYYNTLGNAGILNCGATANNNVNIDVVGDMPTGCSSPYMVSVTATNNNDQRTFSAYGANTIDLGAPGSSVYLPSGSSSYSNTSGTSFASPCVAGAIALVYSAPCAGLAAIAKTNPLQGANLVRGYILNGVDAVGGLQGFTVTGGRLNVKNSIDLALADCVIPNPCTSTGISLTTDCVFNEITGTFDASVTVSGTFSGEDCSAGLVCYRFGNLPFTCVDPSQNGGAVSNTESYTITGLVPALNYSFYYTTDNGDSQIATITTADCSEFVLGCTDPNATNYNPLANIDDGSCEYNCSSVTLYISTDCNGEQVSWDIRDAGNNVVASAATGTYGDVEFNIWNGCLNEGCYTFNIYDTAGDGMNGQASGCSVNGEYFMTDVDADQLLFSMTAPNAAYGFGASHNFCVGGTSVPCQLPYPVATGLIATPQANGVLLQWNPVPGSIACRLQGGLANGTGPTQSAQVFGDEPTQFFAPQSIFAASTKNYRWRVRCRCADDVQAPWSPYANFTYPPPPSQPQIQGRVHTSNDLVVFPNPGDGLVNLVLPSSLKGESRLGVYNTVGVEVFSLAGNNSFSPGVNQIDLRHLASGIYLIQFTNQEDVVSSMRFVLTR